MIVNTKFKTKLRSIFFIFCILSMPIKTTAINGFKYQMVLRNADGVAQTFAAADIKIEILQGSTTSQPIYTETHKATTSAIGLLDIVIGSGTTTNNFAAIEWKNGPFFIRTTVNNVIFPVTQLLNVPFASYADVAGQVSGLKTPVNATDATPKAYVDSMVNNLMLGSGQGDTLFLGGQKYIIPGLNSRNIQSITGGLVLGGTGNEQIKAVVQLADGSWIIGGETTSNNGNVSGNHGQRDIWIAKISADLKLLSAKCFGGSDYDQLTVIKKLANGNILLGGTTESNSGDISGNHGNFDIWIAEITPALAIERSVCLGGTNTEFLTDVVVTSDNGYLVAGTTLSGDGSVSVNKGSADIWLAKLNSQLVMQWNKSYGGSRYDALAAIVPMDNNFALVGHSESNDLDMAGNNGALDIWVGLINSTGTLLKTKMTGTISNEMVKSVVKTDGNNLIVNGITFADNWDPAGSIKQKNIFVFKIDASTGSVAWTNTIGGFDSETANYAAIVSGNLFLGGTSSSADGDFSGNKGDSDGFGMTITSTGTYAPSAIKQLGGTGIDEITGGDMIGVNVVLWGSTTSNDGDLKANYGGSDLWICTLNTSGILQKSLQFGGSQADDVFAVKDAGDSYLVFAHTKSNDYGISGFHGSAGNNTDMLVFKMAK